MTTMAEPRKLEAKLSRTRKAKAEGKFGNSEAIDAVFLVGQTPSESPAKHQNRW